jgi:hypothetical protein
VRCAACGNVWIPSFHSTSVKSKIIVVVSTFLLLILLAFAVSFHDERSNAIPPLKAAIHSTDLSSRGANAGLRHITIQGAITNQTDSILRVPTLTAVLTDTTGNTERVRFPSPSPLLIGGESVEFSEEIEYNISNPIKISIEFGKDD